jgi:hypothetical protein
MMPVSLNSDGLTLYKSRGWGEMPEQLRKLGEAEFYEQLMAVATSHHYIQFLMKK